MVRIENYIDEERGHAESKWKNSGLTFTILACQITRENICNKSILQFNYYLIFYTGKVVTESIQVGFLTPKN